MQSSENQSLFARLTAIPEFGCLLTSLCAILEVDPREDFRPDNLAEETQKKGLQFLEQEMQRQNYRLSHLLYLRGQYNFKQPHRKVDFTEKWMDIFEQIVRKPGDELDVLICAQVMCQILVAQHDSITGSLPLCFL